MPLRSVNPEFRNFGERKGLELITKRDHRNHRDARREKAVKFELVWRNPAPPERSEREIEATEVEASGAVYLVRSSGVTTAFELIVCRAA